jgi:hypothetical protein
VAVGDGLMAKKQKPALIWHRLSDVKPTDKQLIGYRAPAIDEMGYLVTALFKDGEPICCDVPIIWWAEISPPQICE